MEGRSSNNEKKSRYIIMKNAKKVFEVLIIKWVVKVRINASSMAFLANWTLLYFPIQP